MLGMLAAWLLVQYLYHLGQYSASGGLPSPTTSATPSYTVLPYLPPGGARPQRRGTQTKSSFPLYMRAVRAWVVSRRRACSTWNVAWCTVRTPRGPRLRTRRYSEIGTRCNSIKRNPGNLIEASEVHGMSVLGVAVFRGFLAAWRGSVTTGADGVAVRLGGHRTVPGDIPRESP
jgi:hypothetical protein